MTHDVRRTHPPSVVIFGVEDTIHDEVRAEVQRQWPAYEVRHQLLTDPWAYARDLRAAWRRSGDLVVIEHDVVPPEGAIRALLMCPDEWCTHPHWVGERYLFDTLGLVKFGADLRYLYPSAADRALAGVERLGRTELLPLGEEDPWASPDPINWPATAQWNRCDTRLSRYLVSLGYRPHVHAPPTNHLRDYGEGREQPHMRP